MKRQDVRLLFVHGWGFSPFFWHAVQKELTDFSSQCIDLGFFHQAGQSDSHSDFLFDLQDKVIAIGHSLGFNYLLKNFPDQFHYYIAINSFTRFVKGPDFPNGTDPRILERMARGLNREGEAVLKRFYHLCGTSLSPSCDFCPDRLQEGLHWLKTDDCRLSALKIRHKITVVASTHDPVVPTQMTKDSFPCMQHYWIQDDTHLLPLTRPRDCAEIIRNRIENV